MAVTSAEAIQVHNAIHDKSKKTVELNGQSFIIEEMKAKKNAPVYRKCTAFGVQFMEQNHTTSSKFADMARNGSKITWIPWGRNWGRIVDGVIQVRCAAINDALVRNLVPSISSVPAASEPQNLSGQALSASLPQDILSLNAAAGNGVARKKQKREDGAPVITDMADDTVLKEWIVKYEDIVLGEKIGAGAFGEVRKGRFADMDVAVKILFGIDDKAVVMFRKEAAMLATLTHENIVPCIGFCVNPGQSCLIMEFMPTNLSSFLKEHHPLSDILMHKIALGIIKGVAYLHSRKVIHRDLKPANILLDSTLNPRIADFGVSREAADNMTLTKIGTPTYCAPEVLNGEKYTCQVDIYSYAMILCAMATGGNPWKSSEALSPAQIIMRVVVKKERPPLPTNVTPFFRALVVRCWDQDPSQRPLANQIVSELVAIASPPQPNMEDHTASTLVIDNLDVPMPLSDQSIHTQSVHSQSDKSSSKVSASIYDDDEESDEKAGRSRSRAGYKKRCKYDDKCYRKDPLHFAQFSHPRRENKIAYKAALAAVLTDTDSVSRQQKKELMALKEINEVTDEEHDVMIRELGWSNEEYASGSRAESSMTPPSRKRKSRED